MNKRHEIEQKILNWNKWIHVVLTIFTYFIWLIVLLIIYIDLKSSEQNTKKVIVENQTKPNNENNAYKIIDFHVAGVTFNNRQSNIKKIVKYNIDNYYVEPYSGTTNKEILEYYDNVGQVHDQELYTEIKFDKYKYENEDAISVKLSIENDFLEIGNVPKKNISELLQYIDNNQYTVKTSAYVIGGKFKKADVDEYGNDKVTTYTLDYGIELKIKIYKK